MQEMQKLVLGDLDAETGYLYCGGQEGYVEVLKVLFADMLKNREQVESHFAEQNWKLYVIAVHGVKSSMLSIGALALSEMAKKLEFAGKNQDYEYINEHHNEMLKEYDRVYQILAQNPLINIPEEKIITECNLPEIEECQMEQYVSDFEAAVYDFEEDKMLEVLSLLQQYQWHGKNLQELLRPVKQKVEMMDYMSALDMLQKLS